MSIHIDWEIPGHVIRTQYPGSPGLQDLTEANRYTLQLMADERPPVHHILDATDLQALPLQMPALLDALSFIEAPQAGWQVFAGEQYVVHFLVEAITRLTKAQVTLAPSVDAALGFLYDVDPELPG